MKFAPSAAAALLAYASAVFAQTTHEVTVAPGKTQTYAPPSLQIAIGDTVHFTWAGGPHTVTQMGLNGDPCGVLPDGIDSAKQNATATLGLKFNTAGKRLFGCTVAQHCKNGMQLAIDVLAAGATPSTAPAATSGAPSATSAVAGAPAASATPAYPATTTPAAGGTTAMGTGTMTDPIIVTVGDGGLTFTPKDIVVKTGSWVEWKFASGPHNVHQVAKNGTCDVQPNGFGTAANMMAGGTYMQQFNTTGVNWYVCTVAQHCQKGMTGSVTVSDTGLATGAGAAGAAAAPTTHTILVGQGGLTFTPAALTINQGDTVNWQFLGTHNVKQTASADSCDPLAGGFASTNTDAGGSFNRTFTTETGKVWYVCTYQGHCGQGMKAVITVNAAGGAATNGTATPAAPAGSSATGIQSHAPFVAAFAALLAGSMLVL
ncbi:Cupredoxin [Geranomyces variabilis]|nr:Cupredoxin [Geranomyces variabilis]KAJ3138560.1 hypothetical protein HDU90_001002 [Geranomyces variabilis]